ncbi:GtrA family protein [Bremerella sp. P1]|uniref:GtrA family protein n=1 Tax=Bremerella sp. P1 TaxID=3026424 RepID=UPI002368D590|nr:GtrA family protein [Bremerella sp. P1]WDI43846.1 GtrA family protein [Bremerella sp. P1]
MPSNSNESSSPKVSRQILRFLVIGGSSVAIDGICYALITTLSGISPDIAKGISYVCGMLFGFWGNKLWTFESTKRSVSEPIVYVVIYACTLGLNVGINRGVLLLAGDEFRLLGFFLATGTTTVANFVGMKFLAFRQQVPANSDLAASPGEPPEVAIPTSDRRAA